MSSFWCQLERRAACLTLGFGAGPLGALVVVLHWVGCLWAIKNCTALFYVSNMYAQPEYYVSFHAQKSLGQCIYAVALSGPCAARSTLPFFISPFAVLPLPSLPVTSISRHRQLALTLFLTCHYAVGGYHISQGDSCHLSNCSSTSGRRYTNK